MCLVLCAALGFPATATAAAAALDAPERRAFEMVNDTREARDRRPLTLARRLSRYSERHARRMARRERLSHPDVGSTRYDALGYIVGVGDTVRAVHRAFLRSRVHRRIIVGRWRVLGVGIVRHDGQFWVVQIYAR